MLKKHVLVYVILLFAIVIFNTHIDASDAKTDKLREICAKLNVHEKASNVYDIVATEKYQALPVIKHFTASYSPTCIVLEFKKQRMILNIKDKIFTTI